MRSRSIRQRLELLPIADSRDGWPAKCVSRLLLDQEHYGALTPLATRNLAAAEERYL